MCCAACRQERDRRLARKRRRAEVANYRAGALERKRAQRAREREQQRAALTAEGERVSWQESGECHAPASAYNRPKLLVKIAKIVDDDLKMSRARLHQEIAQVILETAAQGARARP